MARKRKLKGRMVNGILLLDKPAGITSNDALQRVKRIYHAQKAGHTGSLDKMASGLLPICLGEATKFSSFLLDADKYYIADCRLGSETTTGDAAGEIKSSFPVPDFSTKTIASVLEKFRGKIDQVPPMYSALKFKGQRLYSLAYKGISVERKPRQVCIYDLQLVDYSGDKLTISVHCSKGTYIRTLAEDIGKSLGCGAHVENLRRTGSGPYRVKDAVSLSQLEKLASPGMEALDQKLLTIDSLLKDMPETRLADSVAYYFNQGQAVTVPHAPTEGKLRIYNQRSEFLGIGEILDDGRVAPRRLISR